MEEHKTIKSMKILQDIKDICERYEKIFAEEDVCQDILDAFTLEKPLSSIEIYFEPLNDVRELEKELSKFFFIREVRAEADLQKVGVTPTTPRPLTREEFAGIIFVSRFKTLPDVAVEYDHLSDEYADLAGILYGYGPRKTAEYLKKRKRELFKEVG